MLRMINGQTRDVMLIALAQIMTFRFATTIAYP